MKPLRLMFYSLLTLTLLAAVTPLAAQQDLGYLKTKVNPGRAGVFIDGKYVGPAANFRVARKYAVAAGSHEVKLVDPRYEEYTTQVQIQARKTTTIRQALKALPPAKPPFGRLRIEGFDKYAAVYVNGKFCGHADEFNNSAQGLLLNPGQYEVRVEPMSGGTPVTDKVTIEAGKVAMVKSRK
jgi:PEGA domain-containing protein